MNFAEAIPLFKLHRVTKSLCVPGVRWKNSVYSKSPHIIDHLKIAIKEYVLNVERAILNTVFENTIRRVNKCLVTGEENFEHYL
jgi:hypothetical protein